jgi:hypothetical protein
MERDRGEGVIKRETVFVLGAGASQPYGFPLGAELVDKICAEIIAKDKMGIVPRLEEADFDSDLITRFALAMREARPYSVDAFLETRGEEFRDVGKAAIADVLARAEDQGGLESAAVEHDWYRYLFNQFLVSRKRQNYSEQVVVVAA